MKPTTNVPCGYQYQRIWRVADSRQADSWWWWSLGIAWLLRARECVYTLVRELTLPLLTRSCQYLEGPPNLSWFQEFPQLALKMAVVDMIPEHIISCPRLSRVVLIIEAPIMPVTCNRHTSPQPDQPKGGTLKRFLTLNFQATKSLSEEGPRFLECALRHLPGNRTCEAKIVRSLLQLLLLAPGFIAIV